MTVDRAISLDFVVPICFEEIDATLSLPVLKIT
jgi:hypothetical protein